jgi:hypothetical protein
VTYQVEISKGHKFQSTTSALHDRCQFLLAGGFLPISKSLSTRPRILPLTPTTSMFFISNYRPVTLCLKRWKVKTFWNSTKQSPRHPEHHNTWGQCFPLDPTNQAVHFRQHANGRADVKRLPSRSLPGPIRNKGHQNTQVRDCAVCYTSRMQRSTTWHDPTANLRHFLWCQVLHACCICPLICQSGTLLLSTALTHHLHTPRRSINT